MAIIAYAIFQILLVMFVILPEKEREAAASFKRAVAKARHPAQSIETYQLAS
ncbi:hypothetical protein GCM10025858_27560 [Alicyclobacillus sacchari]|uniref:hypothetical protein n=1 Tax=Alicyclobacillus sacchari TaxID=392010 RepID=UPI0023EA0BE2|nr:hypothetical protein [Alicyclobacillus sacchari]GMA58253.1 hypothetical protein GCM10025858_27560 [Alicyclobacillus sacchari]